MASWRVMSSRKPTSRDVATAAGVSQTTVSYVMSGRRAVSPATQEKVLAAMQYLGYRPHRGARALKSQRTHILGVVVPYRLGADAAAQHHFLVCLATAARRHDYDLLLLTTDEGPAGLRRVIDSALCDGLLIMEVLTGDPRVETVRASHTPAVFIGLPTADAPGTDSPVTAVDADYVAAGRQAVDTLTRAGHHQLTLVLPDHPSLDHLNFLDRFAAGATEAARQQGAELREVRCGVDLAATRARLAELAPATGAAFILGPLVGADNWCNALGAAGLPPGQATSLIAAAWDPPHSHTLTRPTHFDMRTAELAERAVELLVAQLSPARPTSACELLAPRLVAGNSVRG
ncbi:LacI family transcriptional regulator [Buchananella hordeovulneris]|nr:LacI family transcriptional regulator [Buchananella hordeovulneris]